MTGILPVEMSSIEDRSAVEIDLWVPRTSPQFKSQKSLIISNEDELISHLSTQISGAAEQIFISTEVMDETLATPLTAAIHRGVSVYILIEKEGFSQSLSDLPSSVLDGSLIRSYDGNLPCTLLIDPGPNKGSGSLLRSATRLNRSLDQPSASWAISLNPSQTSSLAAQMIGKFWDSKVDYESRNTVHADSPQVLSGVRPSLVAQLPPSWFYSGTSTPPSDFLKETTLSKSAISSGLTAREMRNTKTEHGIETWSLTCRDQPEEVPPSGRHLIGNCQIKAILTEGGQGIVYDLVPSSTSLDSFSSGIRLSKTQTTDLIHNLESINDASLELQTGIPVGDLKLNTDYLLRSGQKVSVLQKQEINAGVNSIETLDLELLSTSSPSSHQRPEHEPLALEIHWTWVNVPPTLPKKCKLHSIEVTYSTTIEQGLDALSKLRKAATQRKMKAEIKKMDKLPSEDSTRLLRTSAELRNWVQNLHNIRDSMGQKVDSSSDDGKDALSIASAKLPIRELEIPSLDNLPAQDLPQTGKLYSDGNMIYLEIPDGSAIAGAESESSSWDAILVAKKEWS